MRRREICSAAGFLQAIPYCIAPSSLSTCHCNIRQRRRSNTANSASLVRPSSESSATPLGQLASLSRLASSSSSVRSTRSPRMSTRYTSKGPPSGEFSDLSVTNPSELIETSAGKPGYRRPEQYYYNDVPSHRGPVGVSDEGDDDDLSDDEETVRSVLRLSLFFSRGFLTCRARVLTFSFEHRQ